MKTEYRSGSSVLREQITPKGFADILQILKKSFANLSISDEQAQHLFEQFKYCGYKQLKQAAKSIVNTQETLRAGTNLVHIIKKNLPISTGDDRNILGWLCDKCHKPVPLDQIRCSCDVVSLLSESQRNEMIGNLRKLGCHKTAKAFLDKWQGKTNSLPDTKEFIKKTTEFNYDDEIPF